MSKGLTRGGFAAIFLWFCRLDKRFEKSAQFSANRHVYYVDIKTEEEIDGELGERGVQLERQHSVINFYKKSEKHELSSVFSNLFR